MLARIGDQFNNFWQRQRPSQRIILITIAVLLIVVVPIMIIWASTPSYGVAFSGLSDSDAGTIVEKLQSSNTPYKLEANGTILVRTQDVYEVRMSMAKDGLPEGGNIGFEVFSGNTLGMTEFTQRVNYQRALEGELERTIASIDAVNAVRVHIVTPEKALLTTEQAPTTASVTIQEKTGKRLESAQVRAISYLVANSVEGLQAENVTIVDTEGNLLASGTGSEGAAGALSQVDDRRAAELAFATDIQTKVKNLLDITLGPNRSVVQANVMLDWSEKQITTQEYAATPVVSSEQTLSESYVTNGETVGGIPGASSNLPTPVAGVTGEGNNLVYQRVEQTTNYELTTTQTHETVNPGQVKQVSLSVLVDGVTDATQLQALQTAISAAAGINQERGDIISVQSLTFDRTYTTEQEAAIADSERQTLIIRAIEIGAVILLVLFLLWYIQRLLKNLRMASVEVWSPVMKQQQAEQNLPSGKEGAAPAGYPQFEPGESMAGMLPSASTSAPAFDLASLTPAVDLSSIPTPSLLGANTAEFAAKLESQRSEVPTPEEEQMQRVVARLAEDSPASVAEIIQLWLNEDKKSNG